MNLENKENTSLETVESGKALNPKALLSFEEEETKETEIDLVDMFFALFDKLHIIILCTLVGALLLNAFSYFFIKPTYQSTSKIYVVSASKDSVIDFSDINVGTSLTLDYEQLILSYPVLSKVSDSLSLNYTMKDLQSMIAIENPSDTRILNITVTSTDPKEAMNIANKVMDFSIDYLPDTMSSNAPNVAERARIADQKTGPSYTKYTMIGAVIGLLLSCGVIIARYLMDDTIHSAEDMEKYFGVAPLSVIPENESLDDGAEETSQKRKRKKV